MFSTSGVTRSRLLDLAGATDQGGYNSGDPKNENPSISWSTKCLFNSGSTVLLDLLLLGGFWFRDGRELFKYDPHDPLLTPVELRELL